MSDNKSHPETSPETMPGGPENLSSSSNEQTVIKSDNIWFEDGNIVLQTATKRYRVHKGVLATHSSIFKDMLSLPQPVEETEVFEGCPVIHLTDLTEDWDELLPLFYSMRDLRNKRGHIDLHLVVAILRLGHKYSCDRFKAQALEYLQLVFPSDFYSCRDIMKGETMEYVLLEEFPYEYEFYLVDIALDLGIQTVLPLALFTCLTHCSTKQILNGSYHISEDEGPAPLSGMLRPQTRETLIRAKETIIGSISDKIYPWWRQAKTSQKCTTKDICADIIRKKAMRMIGVPKIEEIFNPKVMISSMKALCQHCKEYGANSTEEAQRQVFDTLPSHFGLPKWGDLKDFETVNVEQLV